MLKFQYLLFYENFNMLFPFFKMLIYFKMIFIAFSLTIYKHHNLAFLIFGGLYRTWIVLVKTSFLDCIQKHLIIITFIVDFAFVVFTLFEFKCYFIPLMQIFFLNPYLYFCDLFFLLFISFLLLKLFSTAMRFKFNFFFYTTLSC